MPRPRFWPLGPQALDLKLDLTLDKRRQVGVVSRQLGALLKQIFGPLDPDPAPDPIWPGGQVGIRGLWN